MTDYKELIKIMRDIATERRNCVGDFWSHEGGDLAADKMEELTQGVPDGKDDE